MIKALDPDWIRIRIGVHPKMSDPDPDEINADPQPCMKNYKALCAGKGLTTFSHLGRDAGNNTIKNLVV
jgi:hypothetical protein